jgi:hypothetical protein
VAELTKERTVDSVRELRLALPVKLVTAAEMLQLMELLFIKSEVRCTNSRKHLM